MLLKVQIQAMLYAFLIGFGYGISFSFKQYLAMYRKNRLYKGIEDICFHILFVCFAYYGLFCINGGVSNIYLFLLFFIGIYIYYLFYYEIFLQLYQFLFNKLKPFYKKAYLLISRYYSIICSRTVRKKSGKKKSKKKNITI